MHDTDWQDRWPRLAAGVGLGPEEPLLVALSGGADSVLLALLVARAEPRPRAVCVHVDHGLRGAESEGDAAFCARLCRRLSLPLVRRRAPLGGAAEELADLEARARGLRYRALLDEAARHRVGAIATGHHADDLLETLLLRWMRGTALEGLAGLRPSAERRAAGEPGMLRDGPHEGFGDGSGDGRGDGPDPAEPRARVRVVRPLLGLRRAEVHALLRAEGIGWREDSSNASPRFARNRVRHLLLPHLAALGGTEVEQGLFAFAQAVERLEAALAERTAPLAWRPFAHAAAARGASSAHRGGTLPRGALLELAPALLRRALWRLLSEATGRGPSRPHLERILADLARGRCRRHALPGGWTLALRGSEVALMPPPAGRPPAAHGPTGALAAAPRDRGQPPLPFARPEELAPEALRLPVPGAVELGDGRAIAAAFVDGPAGRPPPRSPIEVELDPRALDLPLFVRTPRPGDRFRGLGAPGSRPLARVLADAGIPREERARVPLVLSGDEIVWVAGLRPCEARRVRPGTPRRLALTLVGAARSRPRVERQGEPEEVHGLFAAGGARAGGMR